jgi:hypothetical protein
VQEAQFAQTEVSFELFSFSVYSIGFVSTLAPKILVAFDERKLSPKLLRPNFLVIVTRHRLVSSPPSSLLFLD